MVPLVGSAVTVVPLIFIRPARKERILFPDGISEAGRQGECAKVDSKCGNQRFAWYARGLETTTAIHRFTPRLQYHRRTCRWRGSSSSSSTAPPSSADAAHQRSPCGFGRCWTSAAAAAAAAAASCCCCCFLLLLLAVITLRLTVTTPATFSFEQDSQIAVSSCEKKAEVSRCRQAVLLLHSLHWDFPFCFGGSKSFSWAVSPQCHSSVGGH